MRGRSRQECPKCKKWLAVERSVNDEGTWAWYVCKPCGYHSDKKTRVYSQIVQSDAAFLRRLLLAARKAVEWEQQGDEAWRRYFMTELNGMVNNVPAHLAKQIWGPPD